MYIYMNSYTDAYKWMYVCVYTQKEREREKEGDCN